jgi:DNA polymerase IIIc chi subunit
MSEEPAAYFRSSEEREFEQAPGPELYTDPNEEDTKPTDPVPSPAAVSPISGLSAGFTAQFADYVRAHQQEAQDAEERWKNATIEEWKAGKYGE